MRAKTTDDLIRDIKARTASANSDGLLQDQQILDLVYQEMVTEIARTLMTTRSEYWVRTEDQAIVSGQSLYRIPDDALGMGLRDVIIVDSSGTQWAASQVPATDRYLYAQASAPQGPAPFDFALENGCVVLLPAPNVTGQYTLKLRYYRTPSRLVPVADAARITGASSSTLTLASNAGLNVVEVGSIVDIVRGGGMFEPIATELTVSSWDGSSSLGFTPSLSTEELASISTGSGATAYGGRQDYVCISGETVFPPIPIAMYPMLVALGCRAVSEVRMDAGGYQLSAVSVNQKKEAALSVMVPRVDGRQIKTVQRNTPLRGGARRRSVYRGLRG